jgi:hypothetical protein
MDYLRSLNSLTDLNNYNTSISLVNFSSPNLNFHY